MTVKESFKLDPFSPPKPLGAKTLKPRTLLVHPYNSDTKKDKPYLLETPTDLKRRTPLLEIPTDNKKPRLYTKETNEKREMKTTSIQTQDDHELDSCRNTQGCQKVKICRHCCCGCEDKDPKPCSCQGQPVKVIFAPTMMPSLFGAGVPGVPYIMKQPPVSNDKIPVVPMISSPPAVAVKVHEQEQEQEHEQEQEQEQEHEH
ncbi:uncharacterized protein LOC121736734 [Aricia agestis]|uniref:uncharacterized protein LOC121736734 n=1 Tax=Aricia agestis TaxID=91739 RepID=UPI001C201FCC|nr:uncharacterized protein LOC121736734 [Aricia agestis]